MAEHQVTTCPTSTLTLAQKIRMSAAIGDEITLPSDTARRVAQQLEQAGRLHVLRVPEPSRFDAWMCAVCLTLTAASLLTDILTAAVLAVLP